ncbi:hypothetical protein CIG53_22360 [Enterobacter asburiae]|nr:hypothetical protein CIG53_22360 [Enterobacter asburiae]QBB08643.1 hypothetical protein EVV94_27510 [Enterobacter cloacae]
MVLPLKKRHHSRENSRKPVNSRLKPDRQERGIRRTEKLRRKGPGGASAQPALPAPQARVF